VPGTADLVQESPALPAATAAPGPAALQRGLFERAAILVPVHNAESTMAECLVPLTECAGLGAELHVVDDTSTDGSVDVALRFPAARLHCRERRGSSGGARNTASVQTRREFLVYVDADVVVTVEQVGRMLQRMADGACDAVVGCYGEDHDHLGLISQYKNLWIRRTYLHSPRRLTWFWTAFCAVRREAFERVGGFNENYQDARGGVDFEFGWRLHQAGGHILLDPSLTCRHLKRFTLPGLLRNDYIRARGYVIQALTLRAHSPIHPNRFANVRASYFLAGVAGTTAVVSAILALVFPLHATVSRWVSVYALVVWALCQVRFLAYFGARRGGPAAILIVPVMFLDQVASFAGVAEGVAAYLAGERAPSGPGLPPATSGPD
jgi:GT2 family glycosyltransferase